MRLQRQCERLELGLQRRVVLRHEVEELEVRSCSRRHGEKERREHLHHRRVAVVLVATPQPPARASRLHEVEYHIGRHHLRVAQSLQVLQQLDAVQRGQLACRHGRLQLGQQRGWVLDQT